MRRLPTGSRRPLRAGARAALLVPLAATAALALPAGPALAAATLAPTANCVWANGDGTYTGVFGYANTTKKTMTIAQGAQNQVYAGYSSSNYWTPVDANPPTTFPPGSIASAVTVSFPDGGGAAWDLNGSYVSLSSTSASCATQPLPTTNDEAVLGIAALATAAASLVLGRHTANRRTAKRASR